MQKANIMRHGYLASGLGACLCTRHSFVHKNGVADLRKGERWVLRLLHYGNADQSPISYCTMDYILLATLAGSYLLLFITYDIACQYYKNFLKRMQDFPPCMQLKSDVAPKVQWAIPKKHWAVHGPSHSRFSLNFLQKCGRMYGEGIESS